MTGRKANEDIWSDRTEKVIGNGKVDMPLTHNESFSEVLNFVTGVWLTRPAGHDWGEVEL